MYQDAEICVRSSTTARSSTHSSVSKRHFCAGLQGDWSPMACFFQHKKDSNGVYETIPIGL